MGCTCSTPEKAVAVEVPTKKKSTSFAPSPKEDPQPQKFPYEALSPKGCDKNLSTRNAVGDSLISIAVSPRLKPEIDTQEDSKPLFRQATAREDNQKQSVFKPPQSFDSTSSFDAKESLSQYGNPNLRSDDMTSRDSAQRFESSFSQVSKPSIFGLPSITSDKNTLQKLHEAIHLNIPKNDETLSINASMSSFRGDTCRSMQPLLGDNRENTGRNLVPSCGLLLSPRPILVHVPEESGDESERGARGKEENSYHHEEVMSVHNRLLEIAKNNEKNRYRRHDSMDSSNTQNSDPYRKSGRNNSSITAKGYKIEITDLSHDYKNHEESQVRITDIELQPDSKIIFKKPFAPMTDSPRGLGQSYSTSKRHQTTLGIPPLEIREKILEETNESHSGGSRESARKPSPPKEKLQTKAPLVKPIINITKEDTLQNHIKTKFRVNLLDMVLPKTPAVIPEKDEDSTSRAEVRQLKEIHNSSPVNYNPKTGKKKKEGKEKEVKEKSRNDSHLLSVDNRQIHENSPVESRKSKVIPRPLDFQTLELFSGSDLISPIYHIIKHSGGSTPVDSQGNSTFLRPLTITIDNIASVEDRHFTNGEDNISQFDIPMGKINFFEEGREPTEGSPVGLHPHLPLKRSMFSSKRNLFNKSKSANFDEEGGLPPKVPVSNVDNDGMLKSPNKVFLSPGYDSKISYDTANSIMEVPSLQYISAADVKRGQFTRHRPKSQVIETPHVDKSVDEGGNKRLNQYILGKEMGRGTFGKVKMALNSETYVHCAIKIVNKAKLQRKVFAKDKSAYTQIQTEIAVMKKMDHPNIVKLLEVIDSNEDDKLYLVMELVEKGAIMSSHYYEQEKNIEPKTGLADLKSLPEEKARKYFRHLVLGIDYMHNYANVIHRDIKPENLLISNDDVLKVTDFNIAHLFEDSNDLIKTKGGTRVYMAPEAWTSNSFRGRPLDIWAAGATLYQFLYGAPPFFTTNPTELKRRILEDEPGFPEEIQVNKKAIELIKKCLNKNVNERITIEEIMKDPWVTKNGKEPLSNEEFDVVVANDEDIVKALTTKLHTAMIIATGLVRSLNSARKTLSSMHSITMDRAVDETEQ